MRCEAAAVAEARQWAADQLRAFFDAPGDAADDAALLVSELVTNCVQARCHFFELAIDAHHDSVRVEATDDAPGIPTPVVARSDEPSGRGLLIIEKLAAEWGVDPVPPGKTVWAALEIPEHARARFDCDRAKDRNAGHRPPSRAGRRECSRAAE
jgi:anti-sigma regulatory factor (Ser/Thr protein kinase)